MKPADLHKWKSTHPEGQKEIGYVLSFPPFVGLFGSQAERL